MEDTLLHSGLANYFRGFEAVGGKLSLYADRLYFQSHGIALQAEPHTIYLKDIREVKKRNTMGLIPNGLAVVWKNGKVDKFVLNKRGQWIEKINELLMTT